MIEWSAKLMFKGKHIENASASVRVAPIYNFDRPPQMALLITGANMDLQSFKYAEREREGGGWEVVEESEKMKEEEGEGEIAKIR